MSSAKQNGGILSVIARANYVATGDQVEQLAHVVVTGLDAGTVYLRVVLAHMQAKLGTGRRAARTIVPQEPVLDAIHEELYPHVLKGVGPEEMERDERNSRANFARTMASTVRFFIQHGGDVRTLEIPTVTKRGLRRMVEPEVAVVSEGATRAERGVIRAAATMRAAVLRLAKTDPAKAREEIEQLLTEYEALLEELGAEPGKPAAAPQPDHGATTTIVGRTSGTRSSGMVAPMLHRGA